MGQNREFDPGQKTGYYGSHKIERPFNLRSTSQLVRMQILTRVTKRGFTVLLVLTFKFKYQKVKVY